MKHLSLLKVITILLVASLCFSLLPLPVFATSELAVQEERALTFEDYLAGNATVEDLYGVLDRSVVPEIIGYDVAVAKCHVKRLYEDEGSDLNKVVFMNVDGSKTLYLFDFPVKYIDENGKIQDIRLGIADSTTKTGEFQTASNDIVTTFSAKFSDGISLQGNNTEINLVPVLKTAQPSNETKTATIQTQSDLTLSTAKRIDENTIEYRYDSKTTVEYSLTYTGFKEDIVVSEYTGETTYPFRLYTNGLSLEEINGSYFLVDDQGNIDASIGDIIIFTADEKNNAFGNIVPETIVENQEYLLNIVINADYLADPKTVYPIRIDPTIEINYDASGASAIEDITITTNTNYTGSHTSLYVGRRSTEGVARALMRFPGLDLASLEGYNVTSATVMMRDLMCESAYLDVSCHVFTGNVWDANSATWSNVNPNSFVSTPLHTNTMSWEIGDEFTNRHWYGFDITAAVQGWLLGNYTPNKGIIFKVNADVENGSTIRNRTFGSYNRASYKPSLSVTYTPTGYQILSNDTYYLNGKRSGHYIKYTADGTVAGTEGFLSTLGNAIQWDIQKTTDGYVIRTKNDPTKYLGVVTDTESFQVELVTVSDTAVPSRCFWDITYASGGGSLIQSIYNTKYLYTYGATLCTSASLGEVGNNVYNTRVWRIAQTWYYGNTSSHSARELQAGFSINDLIVNIGSQAYPTISKVPTSAIWAKPEDFTFTNISGTSDFVTINAPENSFKGRKIGIATYSATHKVTGMTVTFKVYVDRFTYELTKEFDFDDSDALLIRDVYTRINDAYSSQTDMYKAWVATRLLSEFTYDGATDYYNIVAINKWDDVAGSVTSPENRQSYFTNVLGFTQAEYNKISTALSSQHNATQTSDFTHMQYAISARLAYRLSLDGWLSNIFVQDDDEHVSYLGGWLGDATILSDDGLTAFGNDDYMADLDAENVFRRILGGEDLITALNKYYNILASEGYYKRATIFKTYLSYSTVEEMVLGEFWGNLDEVRNWYPDTYDFLMSLRDNRAEIYHY